jgi:hypothetical protein
MPMFLYVKTSSEPLELAKSAEAKKPLTATQALGL